MRELAADYTRVVVTGASGFLGGALVRRLAGGEWPVVAAGRDPGRLEALSGPGVELLCADLGDPLPGRVLPMLEGAAIVHCAALSGPWGTRGAFERANVTATRRLVDAAERAGAARFVQISSPSVYARYADQIGLTEETPLPPPINAYAATKAAAEEVVRASGLPERIVIRPRGIYGEGDRTLLPRMVMAARRGPLPLLRGGRAVTDLTHVDDVVAAIRSALLAPALPRPEIVNVSGGVGLRLTEVIDRAARGLGLTVRWRRTPPPLAFAVARGVEAVHRLRPGQPEPPFTAYGLSLLAYSQTLDLTKARSLLGYVPRVGFEDGLRRTLAAWRAS